MQFSQAQVDNPAHPGISKPGYPALAILLVIITHVLFWQLLRHQNLFMRHDDINPLVHYLQVLTIIPKPVAPEISQPVEIARKAEKTDKREIRKESSTSKVTKPSLQPGKQPVELVPDAISQPAPLAINPDSQTSPGLDLDAVRSSALALERQRKPSEIEQIQASHRRGDSLEKRLGEGTKRAEKKECLKAYSGLGLLAVIPLAVSSVVDTGCKW
ncbi:MAG: hypothetical protein HYR68_03595 [Burkholderiales bacterium]|nr:hypothetical protein [Burkholderiales bacterium]MBI3727221.1 hypothetical protein [Burkholderiales bacterium]